MGELPIGDFPHSSGHIHPTDPRIIHLFSTFMRATWWWLWNLDCSKKRFEEPADILFFCETMRNQQCISQKEGPRTWNFTDMKLFIDRFWLHKRLWSNELAKKLTKQTWRAKMLKIPGICCENTYFYLTHVIKILKHALWPSHLGEQHCHWTLSW